MPERLNPARFTIRQLIELDACTRCGECARWCPTLAEKQEPGEISPMLKIERVRSFLRAQALGPLGRLLGYGRATPERLERLTGGVYDCTLCGRCAAVCPVHIDTRPLWIAMRESLVEQGVSPPAFERLAETLERSHNIAGAPDEDRLAWSQNLAGPPLGVEGSAEGEWVYWLGCVASLYPSSYSIPQSMVQVMDRAGVDFITLGGQEWCCGFPLISAGMQDAALELVRHNVETLRRTGARKLVCTCPSCYHTFKYDYPRIVGEALGFEVRHATQALDEWIGEGRVRLKPWEQVVTYHDPCDLGRGSGLYETPRNVIRAIPGLALREMDQHREYALCCGGGGDVEMTDAELASAVAQRRVEQAQATGAAILVSACQQCERTLARALRRSGTRMKVMDVVQLVERVTREYCSLF